MDWQEVKKLALADEWEEDKEDPQWVFPDSTGISNWDTEHGYLIDVIGEDKGGYWESVNVLLRYGLIRRAGPAIYQVWDRKNLDVVDRMLDFDSAGVIMIDVVGEDKGWSFARDEYEDANFDIARLMRKIEPYAYGGTTR